MSEERRGVSRGVPRHARARAPDRGRLRGADHAGLADGPTSEHPARVSPRRTADGDRLLPRGRRVLPHQPRLRPGALDVSAAPLAVARALAEHPDDPVAQALAYWDAVLPEARDQDTKSFSS
jgi:hypothetical protein